MKQNGGGELASEDASIFDLIYSCEGTMAARQ